MPAYVIVDVRITDETADEAFERYVQGTNALLEKVGAKVLIFDQSPEVLEGEWKPRMIVIQEYPSREAIQRLHHSSEYAPLRALRAEFSDNSVVAVG